LPYTEHDNRLKTGYRDFMYTLEPTGIYLSGAVNTLGGYSEESKLIPYEEIKGELKKLNLAEEMITGWNLLKPGLSEAYMGVEGDPLHVVMIETAEGRYLLRCGDEDKFVAEANERLRLYRLK
jgi:hypothetical protein